MPTPISTLTMCVVATTCTLLCVQPVSAQIARVANPAWTMPRTPDGQPDLQGLWGNKTITPMERPGSVDGRAFLTDEEIETANRQRRLSLQAQDDAPAQRTAAGGQIGAYGSYWLDGGDSVLSTGQTSLIVDPPNGQAPIRRWASATKAYRLAHEVEHYQYMSTLDRCLSRGVPGSMLPAAYNNTHLIVQTPEYVVLHHEMIHDLRIIPLSDRAHVDARIGLWMGDARAHWEGDVLVVETTNFHNRGWLATSGAGRRLKGIPTTSAMTVVERYERVSDTTIMWTVTVEDPNVYTERWTISMPLTAEPDYVFYEYACHEGNYSIPNMLAGARMQETAAAQSAP